VSGALPEDWSTIARSLHDSTRVQTKPTATRKSSQTVLETLVPALPELLGGSADLTGSNLTAVKASRPLGTGGGNYIHYGVREFGMAAIANGVALHGGFIPYSGTFAVFSDYARNAIRMSALMRQRSIFVLTHDSIGLGEDGPTHQPVEHAATLRLIPELDVWRPCDGMETAVAWQHAIERHGPTVMLLSRQNLAQQARTADVEAAIARGGYVLADSELPVDVVLIATGSEVSVALAAQQSLAAASVGARVVSMPSTTVFDRQDSRWQRAVLPPEVPRIAVEAGHPDLWRKYVGLEGKVVGLACFGESAPASRLFAHFGLTATAVVAAALEVTASANASDRGQALAA